MKNKKKDLKRTALDDEHLNCNKECHVDKEISTTTNVGTSASLAGLTRIYGEASKEHLVALTGVDNATNKVLHTSLKDVNNYKVNPDFEMQNIKQQAGYAAEISSVAKKNAENIINNSSVRFSRTDDLGRINDQFIDIVSNDGLQSIQMKMVGSNPTKCLDTLIKRDYEKYLYNKEVLSIEIPKEYFNDVKNLCNEQINNLSKQLETIKKKGIDRDTIKKVERNLEKYELIKEKISSSELTIEEAIEARLYPGQYTTKQILSISHRAGIQGAIFGSAIGASVSIVKNLFAVCKDEKDFKDALKDTSFDTLKAASIGYATTFTGSALSAILQNASHQFPRALGNSSLPSMIITSGIEIAKSFYSYFRGDISTLELAEDLGNKGTGILNSTMFATATQMIVPIPVIGALLGGMLGYALSSIFYDGVISSLKEAKFKRIERIRAEEESKYLITKILNYRHEMKEIIEIYFNENIGFFNKSFSAFDQAMGLNNIDEAISTINSITKKLGGKTQYNTFTEFKTFMSNEENFNL